MANLNKKNIKLYAFDIPNLEISKAYSDLMEKLSNWLNEHKGASRNRCMSLNKDSEEEDLLSNYSIKDLYIYGEMTRIVPAKDVPSIPDQLFENETFTLGDLKGDSGKAILAIKDHYYFMLNKSNMVTNLPKTRIKQLETYLNWLLEATRGDKLYKFKDKIIAPKDIKLSDIKQINVIDPLFEKKTSSTKNRNPQKGKDTKEILNFAVEHVLNYFKDSPDLQKLVDEEILSAHLIVKVKKPRKMDEEDYRKALEVYMKPIGDEDGVSFKLNNGKTISGSDLLWTKTVEIEKLDNGLISEPALIQEMEGFLREIK